MIRDVTLGLPANHCCTLHGPSGVFANCPDGKVAFREKAASREAASFKQVILKTKPMTIGTILLLVLILMLIGALPTWPHSRSWGYYPAGGLGTLVLVLLVLVLLGVI